MDKPQEEERTTRWACPLQEAEGALSPGKETLGFSGASVCVHWKAPRGSSEHGCLVAPGY